MPSGSGCVHLLSAWYNTTSLCEPPRERWAAGFLTAQVPIKRGGFRCGAERATLARHPHRLFFSTHFGFLAAVPGRNRFLAGGVRTPPKVYVLALRGATTSTPSGGKPPSPPSPSSLLFATHTDILVPLPRTDILVSLGATVLRLLSSLSVMLRGGWGGQRREECMTGI